MMNLGRGPVYALHYCYEQSEDIEVIQYAARRW
jgi:hypothetical protein